MKKMFVVFSVLLVIAVLLSACGKPAQVATEAVVCQTAAQPTAVAGYTLSEFFAANGTSLVPEFRVMSFDKSTNSMVVNYHGKDLTLVNTYLNAKVYLAKADGTRMDFTMMALFSEQFYNAVVGKDLVIMITTSPYNSQLAMVAIPSEDMPETANLSDWDKTEMDFSIWSYPMNTGFTVVQNSSTGQILIVPFVIEKNEEGHDSVVEPGRQMSAYVHFEKDPRNGFLEMHVDKK